MKNNKILINVCVIETIIIIILSAVMVECICDYNNRTARTEVARFTSEDEKHCIVINEIGYPFLFGSSEIEVIVQSTDKKRTYLKTDVSNDGKGLGEENFDVKWSDDSAVLTVSGEEQDDCTYLIIFDKVFV